MHGATPSSGDTKGWMCVLEFAETDLHKLLHEGGTMISSKPSDGSGSSDTARIEYMFDLAQQIMAGLVYIHSENVQHLDLKPQNICLVEGTHIPKIIDFGLAVTKSSSQMYKSKLNAAGTLVYMAPEFLVDESRGNHKVDVYSYGITVWELYSRSRPFLKVSKPKLKRDVPSGVRPEPFEKSDLFPPRIREVIQTCWLTDPQGRPEFSAISMKLTGPEREAPAAREGSVVQNANAITPVPKSGARRSWIS